MRNSLSGPSPDSSGPDPRSRGLKLGVHFSAIRSVFV